MTAFDFTLVAHRGALRFELDARWPEGPVALIGPNGAGKTSLLRWIAGEAWPAERARLQVHGVDWVDSAEGVWTPPEARRVGYVPQHDALVPAVTVRDNVAFGPRARGATRQAAHRSADAALEAWGIAALAPRWPPTLSGGERQRVALARAGASDPAVWLLDEPTAALDAGSRRAMRNALRDRCAGRPTVLVSHDVRDVVQLCRHVAVLEAGRFVQSGTVAELSRAPATPFVQEFFDGFHP